MYLFRVLNEFDINGNALKNGLASKKMIYDITESYYKTAPEYLKLNKHDRDLFVKEHMNEYLIIHQNNLEKKYRKYCKDIIKTINELHTTKDEDSKLLIKTIYYLSTLNNHLVNGSKTYTEWISLSKKLNSIDDYYNSQSKHKVALIASSTNGYIEEETLAVDVSSRDIINKAEIFCNKIEYKDYLEYLETMDIYQFIEDLVRRTKKEFMGYNFSVSDKEVCYYQYISSNKIVSVLESLQIDLIRCGLFNEEFLELDKKKQLKCYEELKYKLLRLVKLMQDPYMLHIYEELYLKNNNINNITTNHHEQGKIKYTKKLILGLASKIPDIEIKQTK